MGAELRLLDETSSGAHVGECTIPLRLASEKMTARELIARRVQTEVERFNSAPGDGEIYIVTQAELEIGAYSNRFAAHVLRQHQFAALCRERGWGYRLQGGWDSHNVPCRRVPSFDLQAELWVEAAMNTEPTRRPDYGRTFTDFSQFRRGVAGSAPS